MKDNNLLALNGGTTTYNYDTVGNLKSYLYPNGVTTTYNYNSLNRLASMNSATGVSTLSSYTYTLGAAGNRTAVTELSGRTVNYTYDDLYRLTNEAIANDTHGTNGTVGYGYDPVGNRLSRTSSVAGVPSQSSTFDANDRLTSDTYDANGNTKVSAGGSYDYDFENRLITHTSSVTSGFVYDGDGNRVSKTIGGVTTNYLVNTNNHTGYAQVVEEIQGGVVTKQFTYGHDLISQRIVGSGLSFFGYDGHGSVRQLTDATATITDTYDYDAFGSLIYRSGTTPNDYLYSGEQFDANLGFYYLRARYMNPASGRFFSMDSYAGSQSDPLSLHKYVYAANQPVTNVDPSGYQTIPEMNITFMVAATIFMISTLLLLKVIEETRIEMTLRPRFAPKSDPTPLPGSPPLIPLPLPTPDEPSNKFVNIDASTAVAITMENSPYAEAIFAGVRGRQMLMCATAIEEFRVNMIAAGVRETRRGQMLLHMITPIADTPDPQMMAVPDPNGTRMNDKIIFGTGQSWNVQTFTGDARFVSHAESNGIIWRPVRPFIHGPGRFTGQ